MKLSQLRELIKDLPDDTEIIFCDTDTSWLLEPEFFVDEDGLNVISDYGNPWKKPT